MQNPRFENLVDYLPLLAFLGFWAQAAFFGALIIREPELIALGLVTLPALATLVLAGLKIRKLRQEQETPDG